jgi:Zn-dependent metalloprotease
MQIGKRGWVAGLVVAAWAASGSEVQAQTEALDTAGIDRLMRESRGQARVSLHPATGAARFVRLAPAAQSRTAKAAGAAEEAEFFRSYGSIFGIRDFRADLRQVSQRTDELGYRHTVYAQYYRGVPVFAGILKSHTDARGHLYAVNGTFVPGLELSVVPTRTPQEAAAAALAKVAGDKPQAVGVTARSTRLLVFREGLVKGVPGPNRLAYEVEVGNGGDVREFVYIDARNGKWVDQYTGIHDALNRRAYDGQNIDAFPPPTYPATPFWVEGNPFPSTGTCVQGPGLPDCNDEADNVILGSKEAYDLYNRAFGRDSIDGAGAILDGIFDRGTTCPNASWNGTFTSYCPGVTGDDTVAHEWTHAYTQYTHNLIYAWQPGALNEAYSDIYGEVVDLINGRGTDTPDALRAATGCTAFTPLPPVVTVNAPPVIAGDKPAGTAQWGPAAFDLTGDLVLVNDGAGASPNDGCETPFVNAAQLAGKIAILDRGNCPFIQKAANAQVNGAVGLVVANNTTGIINMGGVDPTVTIPSLSILQTDGTAIKAQLTLGNPVNVTLTSGELGTDNSVRWLSGEDDPGFGGAIRDMWNPSCYANPGKVTETTFYVCGTADGGGVHTNSGVPNHGFALLVDGGTYNGQTVTGIGLTKAAHIYFRAMTLYQVSDTDFPDHADALEASCDDLVGQNLPSLTTGAPSGQVITAANCNQVTAAIAAVELRTPPTFCNFQPLLAQSPPTRCPAGQTQVNVFRDTFEPVATRHRRAWATSEEPVTPADFTPRSWERVTGLPDSRPGNALFGPNPDIGTCAAGGDESGVLRAMSPSFPLSGPAPFLLTFDHWVATEAGFDGGILEISVNGGAWAQVPAANFAYNAYNAALAPAPGNTNPLAGLPAFTGTDGGSVSGSWGRSHVNLNGLATTGDSIRLRLSFGNDGCTGAFGWYVDDVTVYRCQP